ESADFIGRDAGAFPCGVSAGGFGQAIDVKVGKAAGLEDANGFAQIGEDDISARDVLENGVGVDEIEVIVGKKREVRAGGGVEVSRGEVRESSPRLGDHFGRDIDAMDFAEVAAHRADEATGAATDFEGAA